jgi:hypothetical protein
MVAAIVLDNAAEGYAMAAERDDSELVKLNLRMHERLRAQIEKDAGEHGISMNATMVDRLERSFERQQVLSEYMNEVLGGPRSAALFRVLAGLADLEKRGDQHWLDDYEAFNAVTARWKEHLDTQAPKMPEKMREEIENLRTTLNHLETLLLELPDNEQRSAVALRRFEMAADASDDRRFPSEIRREFQGRVGGIKMSAARVEWVPPESEETSRENGPSRGAASGDGASAKEK